LPPKPVTAFSLRLAAGTDRAALAKRIDKLPYLSTYDPADRLREFEDTFALLRSIIGGCVGIAVVIATSSIFNAMSATVRERVPEIGLRRAVGATRSQIFLQFLIEAVALGVVGSLAGTIAATILGSGQERIAQRLGWSGIFMPTPGIVVLACAACVAGSALAGALPARAAARLQPVESLRRRTM
jgi:putative ABC transport system permease protein